MTKILDFLIQNAKYCLIVYLGIQFGLILVFLIVDIYNILVLRYFGFDCIRTYFQSWNILIYLFLKLFLFILNRFN